MVWELLSLESRRERTELALYREARIYTSTITDVSPGWLVDGRKRGKQMMHPDKAPGAAFPLSSNTESPLRRSGDLAKSFDKSVPTAPRSDSTRPLHSSGELRPLAPAARVRSGRYQLQEMLDSQRWPSGIIETSWAGRDFRSGGTSVTLCEVVLPDASSPAAYTLLRNATHTLLAAGKHAGVPTLQDVFNDENRTYFVFDDVKGESLQVRMRRLGHPLLEQEVVAMCLQVSELLEHFASQSPPLTYGQIDPAHLYLSPGRSQFLLDHISPLMAGGAVPLIKEMASTRSLPYASPEFAQGMVDGRSDLYALLATAYYALTGIVPPASAGLIRPARQLNAAISPEFEAILAKGLHPVPQQRYQRPSELYQDLLTVHARVISGNLVAPQPPPVAAFSARDNAAPSLASGAAAYPFPIKPTAPVAEDEEALLPAPETLPPMREGNDALQAAVIMGVILLSLSLIATLSHFQV